MANEEHLRILSEGVDRWNQWREENPEVKPDLSNISLFKEVLRRRFRTRFFQVSQIILVILGLLYVPLNGPKFLGSVLNPLFAQIERGSNIYWISVIIAILGYIILRVLIAGFTGSFITKSLFRLFNSNPDSLDLKRVNLSNANLSDSDLSGVDVGEGDLTQTNLRRANLSQFNAFNTNLRGAELTGACIEYRRMSVTSLDEVKCDYVYFKQNEQERCPSDRDFEPGEFAKSTWVEPSKLAVLQRVIDQFETLLNTHPQGYESIFHKYIEENSVVLDVYADPQNIVSKPKFYYPPGESPLGKEYIEPDFIIKYPNNKYKLVELEKPGKHIATQKGQPTAEVNQAAFQATAEWDDYIRNHIDKIKDEYPGIANSRSFLIVIGRRSEKSIGTGRDPARYLGMIAGQYTCEVCTYDDLLDKAKQVYATLSTLCI